jgi:tyrosine decarboxylase/aspartate 1-decarboxylase
MRECGLSEDEVLAFLTRKKAEDLEHCSILSSMCTLPHPIAVRAHTLFMETNLGDPGLFPGTAEIERRLVRQLGEVYHLPDAAGYASSGGTESNIQALRIAKARRLVEGPNVVIPASSHFSFDKACRMLGIEMRTAPLDDQLRVDADAMADLVDDGTVALVGVVGTTEYGMIDPIDALSRLAVEHDLLLHVDAAFGGLVVPFLPDPEPFDFALPGVSTIAVDPHKMGMSTIPAGCLLVRNQGLLDLLNVETPYLTVKHEYTLAGTRPGAPVAAAYAVLEHLGTEGMRAVVAGCMENTRRMIEGLEALGVERAATPDVNVATFRTTTAPPGWRVSFTRRGDMRIVCMPHVTAEVVERFLVDAEAYYV